MVTADLLVVDAAELVTVAGPRGPRRRADQGALAAIAGGAVASFEGTIVAVGTTREVREAVRTTPDAVVLDATGQTVTPGLVDSHTHLVFAGDRAREFELRARGATYAEILAAGGGIHHTVAATRQASEEALADAARRRLDAMLASGTTTCEAKSGYGLDLETELRQLRVARDLDHPIARIGTFLGAHAVPRGQDADTYVDWLIAEALPRVAELELARFCDVFCEQGVFTLAQSERLLLAAGRHGLSPKLHADELADTGGAALAAKLGAVSADHLHMANDEGLAAMARAGTIATLLPGTAVFLGLRDHAPARRMVELGVPVAIATDLNPGSCHCTSLPLMMSFAGSHLGLTPAEALVGCTINGAHAVGEGDRLGSLEIGKQADLVLWDCPDHRHLAYQMGANLTGTVVKRGLIALSTNLNLTTRNPVLR